MNANESEEYVVADPVVCPDYNYTNATSAGEEEEVPCWASWDAALFKYSFATEGVALCVVSIVGIVANLISIAILCQRTMKSQISALLITLAVFDVLFLFCTFPVFSVKSVRTFIEYLNSCAYKDQGTLGPFQHYVLYARLQLALSFVRSPREIKLPGHSKLFAVPSFSCLCLVKCASASHLPTSQTDTQSWMEKQ